MRAVLAAIILALCCPVTALAQSAAAPAASPPAGHAAHNAGDIGRDEYIERAKRNAEKRFDRMDADHDGVLTLEERRAARGKRRAAAPQ